MAGNQETRQAVWLSRRGSAPDDYMLLDAQSGTPTINVSSEIARWGKIVRQVGIAGTE